MAGPKNDFVDRLDALDGTDYEDDAINDQTEDDTSDESEDTGVEGEVEDNDAPVDSTPSNPAQQQPKQKEEQRPELRPITNELAQDAQGNLYDRNGKLLAKHGAERRLYERTIRMDAAIKERDQQISRLQEQIKTSGSIGGEPQRLGLDAEDLRVGYPIIAEFKRDPVAAARKVVEMVMGMGHNLSAILGDTAKDAVEMGAIGRLIDDRLAPLRQIDQERQQREKQQQEHNAALAEVEKFFDSHEHSRVHAEAINNLLGSRPELTPERAYYEIQMFAVKNGLDFSKPLAPQIASLQQAGAQNGNNRQQTRTGQRPMPNGSRGLGSASLEDAESANATDSWDDIIRPLVRQMR